MSEVIFAVLRTSAELEALAPEWLALWQQTPLAKPFQRPEWLIPWWHHFGQPDLPAVTLRRGGVLTGLLPLYVYFDNCRNEQQLLLLGAGTSDYLDGVFAPECTADEVLAALRLVARESTWDTAHLAQLLPHSTLFRAAAVAGECYAGEPTSHCPARRIVNLPKKVRAEVLYFRNAAIGKGKLALRVATAATCAEDFDTLVRLHSESWRERGEPGVLANPAVLAWHREAIPQLLAADLLRLYLLLLDGVPVAALYALIDPPRERRTVYFYLIGHSTEHAALKPGTLLTAMASEHAANEGVTTIDMLRGEETYKKFWHVEEEQTFGVSLPRAKLL